MTTSTIGFVEGRKDQLIHCDENILSKANLRIAAHCKPERQYLFYISVMRMVTSDVISENINTRVPDYSFNLSN